MLKRLPIDISTFSEMRKLNYLYVDKTEHAYNLITGGRRYFLSRPRRFSKTLFVSTLQSILEGKRELFEGLWIEKSVVLLGLNFIKQKDQEFKIEYLAQEL